MKETWSMLNISNLAHETQDMHDIKTKRNRINREALKDAIYVTLIFNFLS